MPLTSRHIPSLLNGVSQQPPSLRQSSQCERLENGFPDLAAGLIKRPPSYHVAKVSGTALGSAHVTVLDYGGDDQFLLVLTDQGLAVYDKTGTAMTISDPHTEISGYLDVTDPVTDFSVVAVEDVAYIVNKTKLVGYTGAGGPGTYKGQVQTFASLPTTGLTNGDVYKIVGDDTVVLTGYYVKWNSTAPGTWEECAYPGTSIEFNGYNMPHKLTWNGTTTFTFDYETYGQRQAGSLTSLPEPNFVARAIRDVFFFRNRLGFLAGEYCILSRSGPDYTNFWRQSATDLLDNDPVDLRAANIKVSSLNYAVPFNKQLLMLSQGTQFILGTGNGQILTPSTGAIDVATNYAANSVAKPVVAGNAAYFPSENTLFASLREYVVSDDSQVANTAEDVTAHVPSYIPAGVFKMTLAENDDTLFLITSGIQNRVYVFKYFWLNDQKVQNAWMYWDYDDGGTILSVDAIGSSLFMLIDKADGCHLHRTDLKDDPSLTEMGFTCHLDDRVLLTGVYDSGNDWTTWTLPYDHTGHVAADFLLVKGGTWTDSYGAIIPNQTLVSTNQVRVTGDWSAHSVYIGLKYTFLYRFSELFMRDGDPDTGQAILNAILHLRTMNIRFSNTGFLRAEVTPRAGADTFQYSFNGMVLDTSDLVIGTPAITTGTFRFPVVADSRRVTIDLINDSHMPSAIVSAEWSGNYTPRAGRRQ